MKPLQNLVFLRDGPKHNVISNAIYYECHINMLITFSHTHTNGQRQDRSQKALERVPLSLIKVESVLSGVLASLKQETSACNIC